MSTILLQMLLQMILILLNAVFACVEIAVLSTSENRLNQLSEKGDKRAKRLLTLTSQPARFLATIQVAITLSGFLGSAFAADNFSDKLVDCLMGLGVTISRGTLDTISVITITLILSYFTLVFGELVPKRIAMKKAEKLALIMSGLVLGIAKLFAPIVWVLTGSTNMILRLAGIDPNQEEEEVSEEEIRMLVDAGNKRGVIDATEKEIIHNVFEFDDLEVSEFMTHRTDISFLWIDESVAEWERTIHETRHTLYPICKETVDHVVGILNVKDYFRFEEKSLDIIMEQAVKQAYNVPETIKADQLFRQMQLSHNHFAVVLDEYGGVSGIVTMNDLLEQLVGDLEDEGQENMEEEREIEQLDDLTWRVKGTAELDKVAEVLRVELPIEEYDTFGGFVFGYHGSIPPDGTEFELTIGRLHIKVLEIREHRIEKSIVDVKDELEKPNN